MYKAIFKYVVKSIASYNIVSCDNRIIYNIHLYHGTLKLSNQIAQFAMNIFYTHLLGGEEVNRSIKIVFVHFHANVYHELWFKLVVPLRSVGTGFTLSSGLRPSVV